LWADNQKTPIVPSIVYEFSSDFSAAQKVIDNFCPANPWQKLLGGGAAFNPGDLRRANPYGQYLIGKPAVCELDMLESCRGHLSNLSYTPISPPDTITPSVAEACYGPSALSPSLWSSSGCSDKDCGVVRIKNDDLFLPGSASIAAMCSLFARRATRPEVALPMRLFATGKVYSPMKESTGCGLLVLMSDRGPEEEEKGNKEI
jgi:hypothetical protein